MNTINPIHTPCKLCVFAKYDNNSQTDCYLGLIEKFKNKNIEILEVYDNDKEFYVVNSKKCFGYRENSWFDKKNLTHLSLEDKISYFHKNNFMHYLLVVDLKHFITEDSLANLKFQLQSLSIKPRKIIMIRHQDDSKCHEYEKLKLILEESNLGCKWRIQTAIQNKDHLDNLHESSNLNKKYRFICGVLAPYEDINTVITTANRIIFDDLGYFEVLANQDKNILLFSAPNYRYSLFTNKKNILDDPESFTLV